MFYVKNYPKSCSSQTGLISVTLNVFGSKYLLLCFAEDKVVQVWIDMTLTFICRNLQHAEVMLICFVLSVVELRFMLNRLSLSRISDRHSTVSVQIHV